MIALARGQRAFSAQESDLFDYLVAQAVISIENADLHEMVQRQAITDELTGLSNVRQMHGALDREFERGRRFNTPARVSCCSTSTTSRRSTTPTATSRATRC